MDEARKVDNQKVEGVGYEVVAGVAWAQYRKFRCIDPGRFWGSRCSYSDRVNCAAASWTNRLPGHRRAQ